MARRSSRKKATSPVAIVESDEEGFAAVISDDLPDGKEVVDNDDEESEPHQNSSGPGLHKKIAKFPQKRGASVRKKRAPTPPAESVNEDVIEITPPPTPSPVKAAGGKKRAVALCESDEEDVFVPSPTRDSPRKARAKEGFSTPSKPARQPIFGANASEAKRAAVGRLPISEGDKSKVLASKSPSKAASSAVEPLSDSTVYLADVEMRRVFVPELSRCQVYQPDLVDPLLKQTYKNIPKLPRMADYAPAWGSRCSDGGFQFSEIMKFYESPDVEYLKRLIAFGHDKTGNTANLSRVDPTMLGVKDTNSFSKNVLYLHGKSDPLLCFSLVLVTCDNHDCGRTLGSDKEWVIKDIAGVLLTMELERLVTVIGLAYQLPYVPDDNLRMESHVLHFAMVDNAFSFTTGMMNKKEFDKAKASSSNSTSTPKINRHKIFAPASPAFSGKAAALSSSGRRPSLRASDTVPVYDGRKRQLNVLNELHKIPELLPRYLDEIPEYSLALMAYTVSSYSPTSGARKDQVTANLHIQFGVVLQEPSIGSNTYEASGEEAEEM